MLVVVLGSIAAWLAAAATSSVRPAVPSAAPRPQIDVRGAALTAEIERLHDRLRPTVAPEHGRNLFQFARSRAVTPAAVAARPADISAAIATPAAPVSPPFKLIGIAEDNGTRTAILTSPNQLLMVRIGDVVASTHRVTGISADAVELAATDDGAVLRLALR